MGCLGCLLPNVSLAIYIYKIYIYTHFLFDLLSQGNLGAVDAHLKRSRSSMDSLVRLTEVPDTCVEPSAAREKQAARDIPLPGENVFVWALQDGADTSTRQGLPEWISKPIEKALCSFLEEGNKWNELIHSRAASGKDLTPAQASRYKDFCDHSDRKFLFSKVSKCVVTKLRSNADLGRVQQEMFSLHVSFSTKPEDLCLRAGTGAPKRLVMLSGEQTGKILLPDCLDQGVSADVMDMLASGELAEGEDGEVPEEAHHDPHEEQALLEEEAMVTEDFDEVLASSDDEELPPPLSTEQTKKVKNFDHRPEYKHLDSKGLAQIPRHKKGVFLSFHSQTRTWEGYYPGSSSGLAFTFAGRTKRDLSYITLMCCICTPCLLNVRCAFPSIKFPNGVCVSFSGV